MEMMMMDNTKSWPEASRMAAKEMTEKYGKPNEMTENAMVWYNNGPWMKTIVYKKEVAHNFLVTHQDVMQQFSAIRLTHLSLMSLQPLMAVWLLTEHRENYLHVAIKRPITCLL